MAAKNINHSAVALPPRSYTVEELDKRLTDAAKADDPDGEREKALKDLAADSTRGEEQGLEPGYKNMEVEDEALGITETTQVFDPEKAEQLEEDGKLPSAPPPTSPSSDGDKAASKNKDS